MNTVENRLRSWARKLRNSDYRARVLAAADEIRRLQSALEEIEVDVRQEAMPDLEFVQSVIGDAPLDPRLPAG